MVGLLQDLMTKADIRGNLSVFTPDIEETHNRGLDYVLGEANSYANHVCLGLFFLPGLAYILMLRDIEGCNKR